MAPALDSVSKLQGRLLHRRKASRGPLATIRSLLGPFLLETNLRVSSAVVFAVSLRVPRTYQRCRCHPRPTLAILTVLSGHTPLIIPLVFILIIVFLLVELGPPFLVLARRAFGVRGVPAVVHTMLLAEGSTASITLVAVVLAAYHHTAVSRLTLSLVYPQALSAVRIPTNIMAPARCHSTGGAWMVRTLLRLFLLRWRRGRSVLTVSSLAWWRRGPLASTVWTRPTRSRWSLEHGARAPVRKSLA